MNEFKKMKKAKENSKIVNYRKNIDTYLFG